MNIFKAFETDIRTLLGDLAAEGVLPAGLDTARVTVEPPREAAHGDLSTNAAMVLAKPAGMPPRKLAETLVERLRRRADVTAAEIAGPGFVNLRLDPAVWRERVRDVLAAGRNAIVIPRPWDFMPGDVAAFLLGRGVSGAHRTEVWENLTRAEATWTGTLGELEGRAFSDMSILLIRALRPMPTGLEGEV